MIDYLYIMTKVKELSATDDDSGDMNLSFLKTVFSSLESVDIDLLNECNESIPARNVQATGYYFNVDENYISIYISLFNQFNNTVIDINEKDFLELKERLSNLIIMINDNSYRDINESRPIYDLCDCVVSNPGMDVILNIITNYSVPNEYDKDGNISIGNKNVSVRTYDINDIIGKLAANEKEIVSLNLVDKFGQKTNAVLISRNSDVDVYLTSFNGEWLAQLYKEDSVGLLSANVRSYLKRTNKVNREIIETVKEAPQEFVAYNNGISAIATGVKVTKVDGSLSIEELENFLIVNGGQTTATLYECKNDKIDLSQIIVPMKLSVIKNAEASEYLISNISIYSNSQTAIKKSDPPSNSKFYKAYEEISKNVFAQKNMVSYHCFFERTNGQYNTLKRMHSKKTDPFIGLNPEKSKFTKLQLAQAVLSWEKMPDLVCKGQEKNFEYFHSIVKDFPTKVVNEDYFKGSYALILLYRKLDQIIKKKKLAYKSNLVAYTLSFLSYKCDMKFDLKKIWDAQEVSQEVSSLLSDMVDDVYEALIDSPDQYPDIRMWSRKTECWERVKKIEKEYSFDADAEKWIFLPENTAKVYFENNYKNKTLWLEMEKWHQQRDTIFNVSQIKMIHGMPAVILKDERGLKKITKKQEAFAKSIFLIAVENGFDFESIGR